MLKEFLEGNEKGPSEVDLHEDVLTDAKIESLICSLHRFLQYAYNKDKGYWKSISVPTQSNFDRTEFIEAVFEKFGESGCQSNSVRKTYGNSVVLTAKQ